MDETIPVMHNSALATATFAESLSFSRWSCSMISCSSHQSPTRPDPRLGPPRRGRRRRSGTATAPDARRPVPRRVAAPRRPLRPPRPCAPRRVGVWPGLDGPDLGLGASGAERRAGPPRVLIRCSVVQPSGRPAPTCCVASLSSCGANV